MAWTQLPSPVVWQHLPFPSGADKQSICTTWNISCFQLKHLHATPQTQLTMCYWIAKTACDSRARLTLKAEEECTWKTFLFTTQCDQKHIYNCFKLFTRQSNDWRSCFLLPPVKLLSFLFAISTFWLFWWNTFLPYCFTVSLILPQDLKMLWNYLSPKYGCIGMCTMTSPPTGIYRWNMSFSGSSAEHRKKALFIAATLQN